jgi:hypothetical protein
MNLAVIAIGMIDRPTQAMAEAAKRPRAWFVPAILLVLSMVLLLAVSAPYQIKLANERSAQMIERLTANMSEEQARLVRENARPVTPTTYWLSGLGAGLVMAALGWVLRGAIVHFSSIAAGGTSTWGPTFAVCLWSMFPFFVRDLVQAAYVLVSKQIIEHQGLSFLVASGDVFKDSRNLAYALLGNVDPFALWHIVLLGIGISVATRLSRGKATFMALVIWLVFLVLKLVPVLLGRAVMGNLGI